MVGIIGKFSQKDMFGRFAFHGIGPQPYTQLLFNLFCVDQYRVANESSICTDRCLTWSVCFLRRDLHDCSLHSLF